MAWRNSIKACLFHALWVPGIASALVVDIQGVRLEPEMAGASCVDIAGVYPGVRIEADQPGQTPRICHNSARINSINIANATFIATTPLRRDVVIKFEHEFPPGINGKIMARAKLRGFFADGTGVGIPTGDQLSMKAFFVQGRIRDMIAEPFEITVGDTVESALFEFYAKKPYLVAGPRALRAELRLNFTGNGHKVTLPDRCLILLDTGTRFEDKLDTLENLPEQLAPPGESPAGEGAPAPEPQAGPAGPAPEAPEPSEPQRRVPPLPPLPPLNPLPPNPL
jgi:hypothetical protein